MHGRTAFKSLRLTVDAALWGNSSEGEDRTVLQKKMAKILDLPDTGKKYVKNVCLLAIRGFR